MKLEKVKNWVKEHKRALAIGAGTFVTGIVVHKTIVAFDQIKWFLKGHHMRNVKLQISDEEVYNALTDYYRNFSGLVESMSIGYNLSKESVIETVSKLVDDEPNCVYGFILDRKMIGD